jgi:hypothetical protein
VRIAVQKVRVHEKRCQGISLNHHLAEESILKVSTVLLLATAASLKYRCGLKWHDSMKRLS